MTTKIAGDNAFTARSPYGTSIALDYLCLLAQARPDAG